MPLIECPDCGRKVSDRAKVCPDCACPVAEVIAEQRQEVTDAEVAKTREMVDTRLVDCPKCSGRGWYEVGELVAWCVICEYTGRTPLAKASDGFYAVAPYAVERFMSGELMARSSGVVFHLGKAPPPKHRYPNAAARVPVDPNDPSIPWDTPDPDLGLDDED